MKQIAKATPAHQTLVQPDIPKPITITEIIPLPTVVIWNGSRTLSVTLVAPLPQKLLVSNLKPSILRPNNQPRPAELSIAASDFNARIPLLASGTTSPVVVRGPEESRPQAITTAAGSAQSTSAAVISLSDTTLANGHVTLPSVNITASSDSSGQLAPGKTTGTSGSQAGSGKGIMPSTTRITLPKDAQFGAVVVGSSLEERYPETAEIWSGRLAYTVYLHVGLAKSWILQYSLSRDDSAASAGTTTRLEAPWPFNIVRPNIAAGSIDADALMIHGFVNQAGRFEALAIVFPPQFAQAQFVLSSLAQWQFRPATHNGKNVAVEILLIIPEEFE